jgi:hypothetical protein
VGINFNPFSIRSLKAADCLYEPKKLLICSYKWRSFKDYKKLEALKKIVETYFYVFSKTRFREDFSKLLEMLLGCVWLRDSRDSDVPCRPLSSLQFWGITWDNTEIVLSQPLTLNQTTLFEKLFHLILSCHCNQTHSSVSSRAVRSVPPTMVPAVVDSAAW